MEIQKEGRSFAMPPGRIKTGRPTMQDIADRLGISKVSVSKALRGQRGVSAELRQKITQTAQSMGYDLAPSSEHYRFAFLVSKHFFLETDAFYSAMYYYFNQKCFTAGHSASLIIVNNGDGRPPELPAELQKESFHGFAIAGEMDDAYLQMLSRCQRPMVLMDFESQSVNCSAILQENYYWGFRTTEYLIGQGHEKIGFVGPVGSTGSITDRYFGYRKALMMHRLPCRNEWQLVNNDPQSGVYTAHISLPEDMPTAFVCHCDMAAQYLLNTLSLRNLRCPRDVSVVSFDNTKLAQINQPPLTSVSIDIRAFAQQAIQTLTAMLENGPQEPRHIYLPSTLILRESVACLNGRG